MALRAHPSRFLTRIGDHDLVPDESALCSQLPVVFGGLGHLARAFPAPVSLVNRIEGREPPMAFRTFPLRLGLAVWHQRAMPEETPLLREPTKFLYRFPEVSRTFGTSAATQNRTVSRLPRMADAAPPHSPRSRINGVSSEPDEASPRREPVEIHGRQRCETSASLAPVSLINPVVRRPPAMACPTLPFCPSFSRPNYWS